MDEPLDRVALKTLRDFDTWTRLFLPRFTRVEQRVEALGQTDPAEMRRMLDRLSLTVYGEYGHNIGLGQEVTDLKRWREEEVIRALQVLEEASEDLRGLRRMRLTVRWLVATAVGAAMVTLVGAGISWTMRRPSPLLQQQERKIEQTKEQLEGTRTQLDRREKQLDAILQWLEEQRSKEEPR